MQSTLRGRATATLFDEGDKSRPSTYSMTRYQTPRCTLASLSVDDIGMAELGGGLHFSLKAFDGRLVFGHRRGSSLMATSRTMCRCWALKTWPMPPAPILLSST